VDKYNIKPPSKSKKKTYLGINVIYLSGDDSIERTTIGHFEDMGANLNRIHVWKFHNIPYLDDTAKYEQMFDKVKPVLIVFDTFQHFFTGDMNSANKTTAAMHSILESIRNYNTCGLFIMHPNKFALNMGGDAMAASIGSMAIQGKFRSSLTAGFAPKFDEKTNFERALCHTKNSLTEGKCASIIYTITKNGINWVRIDHDLTDDDLYNNNKKQRGRPNQCEAAKAFIEEFLDGEMKPYDELKAAAERNGIKYDLLCKTIRELDGKRETVEGVKFLKIP